MSLKMDGEEMRGEFIMKKTLQNNMEHLEIKATNTYENICKQHLLQWNQFI